MMCCNNCGWLRWVTTTNTTYYCEFNGQPLSDLKDCCQAWKSTIQTNADRIRSMTDEELADLLSGGEPYPWCEQDPCPAETCQECIMMWLNQEAKHDL